MSPHAIIQFWLEFELTLLLWHLTETTVCVCSTSAKESEETQNTISTDVIERATVKLWKSQKEIAKPLKH